jgi:hypothetical protein
VQEPGKIRLETVSGRTVVPSKTTRGELRGALRCIRTKLPSTGKVDFSHRISAVSRLGLEELANRGL